MRDSVLFYRSFYEAAKSLNKTERLRFYDAILNYALDGVEPERTGSAFYALYTMAKPIIDANNLRFENGKKGGRPTKPNHNQTETKPKPNHNQTITKSKPNKEEDEDVKENNHVKEEEEEGAHPSSFVLADGSSWFPAVEKIQELEQAFPDVDVHRELLRCQIKHNAMDQRKNVTNIERYVVNWMINAQSDAKKHGSFTDMENHNTPVDAKFWNDISKRGGLV